MLATSSIFIFLNVLAMAPPASAQPGILRNIAFEVIELGELPGFQWSSYATDMNNLGQIVGSYGPALIDVYSYFLYQDGTITITSIGERLSTFNGAINDSGIIAGFFGDIDNSNGGAALWQNGEITHLGTLGGLGSGARGINNLNQVVGFSTTLSGSTRAFLWQDGVMIDLNDLAPDSFSWKIVQAVDINDSGVVIGMNEILNPSHSRGFVMTTIPPINIVDLGFLPDSEGTFPEAINEHGDVVGWSVVSTDRSVDRHAFIWKNGVILDLDSLGSGTATARDINKWGQVVGTSSTLNPVKTRAFIWHDNVMHDLNDFIPQESEWELVYAEAINDLGQIVGTGKFDGHTRAFLLSPCLDANKDKICDSSNDCPANNNPNQSSANPDCGKPDDTPPDDNPSPTLEIPMCGFGALSVMVFMSILLGIMKYKQF